jgi:hypothetical protein
MARLTEIHRQQFHRIIFDVDAQFHDFFFLYPRIVMRSLLLRVDYLMNIEVKAQEGSI